MLIFHSYVSSPEGKIFQCGTTMLNQEIPLPLVESAERKNSVIHFEKPWRARFLHSHLPIENADEVNKCSGYAQKMFLLRPEQKPFTKKKQVFQSPINIDGTLKPKTLIPSIMGLIKV